MLSCNYLNEECFYRLSIYYYGTYSGVLRARGLLFYGGFMEEKVFKTLDDLVDLLKERGVDIPDASSHDLLYFFTHIQTFNFL